MKRFPHGEETTLDFEWQGYDVRLWVANDFQSTSASVLRDNAMYALRALPYASAQGIMLALAKLPDVNAVQVRRDIGDGCIAGCMCYTVPFNESE